MLAPSVATAVPEPSMNVAQRVAALERRLAAELARSAGLQDELARRDVRIRRLEVTASQLSGQLAPCHSSGHLHRLCGHCMPWLRRGRIGRCV